MAGREEKLRLVTAAVVESDDDGRVKGKGQRATVNVSEHALPLFVPIFFIGPKPNKSLVFFSIVRPFNLNPVLDLSMQEFYISFSSQCLFPFSPPTYA